MTIQSAIMKILSKGPASNHDLEVAVPMMVNCNAATVLRELRKLNYKSKPLIKDGKQTRTWVYELA